MRRLASFTLAFNLLASFDVMPYSTSSFDQQHDLSDVLIGAAVGNLVYAAHFDSDGQPRRRAEIRLSAFPAGLALSGRF